MVINDENDLDDFISENIDGIYEYSINNYGEINLKWENYDLLFCWGDEITENYEIVENFPCIPE